jgi:hypothetical protein
VYFSPIMGGNFIQWEVTSSVMPLDRDINHNAGVMLGAISINTLILVMLCTSGLSYHILFQRAKALLFMSWSPFSHQIFKNYIAKDASILHLKSGNSSRSTYFSTSNPSKHTPLTIANLLQAVSC